MKNISKINCMAWVVLWLITTGFAQDLPDLYGVSSQGKFYLKNKNCIAVSPQSSYSLHAEFSGNRSFGLFTAELSCNDSTGRQEILGTYEGNGFLISDKKMLAVIKTPDTIVLPSHIELYDSSGTLMRFLEAPVLTYAAFSVDSSTFVIRTAGSVKTIHLTTLQETSYPFYNLIAAASDRLAGVSFSPSPRLDYYIGTEIVHSLSLDSLPLTIEICPDGSDVYVLFGDRLSIYNPAQNKLGPLYLERTGGQLRDLHVQSDVIGVARRFQTDEIASSDMILLDRRTGRYLVSPGEIKHALRARTDDNRDTIPWPSLPNSQHPIGNAYGAFQEFYPSAPYLHPGIDIRDPAGTAIYAVKSGFVKAILTTSAEYHWRVAIGESNTSDYCEGYLYAHLTEETIAVDVGEWVTQGQYLGDIIEWPVYGFHHLHFTRIGGNGEFWTGAWPSIGNPHLLLQNQSESEPPVFSNARPGSLLAFCENETSNYQDPGNLHGQIDIITDVFDRIELDLECTVQQIRYSIYPVTDPSNKIVDNRESIYFDMNLDNYQGGSHDADILPVFYKLDSTCRTTFEYESRRYFHVITNTSGDRVYEASDGQNCWDTTQSTDGQYIVEVSAVDGAGNEATASMTVVLNNGIIPTETPVTSPTPTPAPAVTPTSIPDYGVRLDIPDYVTPGDIFYITGYLDNPSTMRSNIPVVFILEIDSSYWFWPGWKLFDPPDSNEIDWRRMDIVAGTTIVEVVPELVWPDTGSESRHGIAVYGALLNEDMTAIEGNSNVQLFGYGPE